jgi:hypothetical protein
VKSPPCYVVLASLLAMVPIAMVDAPSARADCNNAGYATVCAQGEVRGPDGAPRAATPVVPYPCENDWYCGSGWDLDIAWDPGFNGPGRPGGIGPRR